MRVFLDLEPEQIRKVDDLAKRQGRSRSALIRDALAICVEKEADRTAANAFGLWRERKIGGLAFQDSVRDEW